MVDHRGVLVFALLTAFLRGVGEVNSSYHGNPASIMPQGIRERTGVVCERVLRAWQTVYIRKKERHLFRLVRDGSIFNAGQHWSNPDL